jgi:hypothetical protein
MNKTITINPELFAIGGRRSRKKAPNPNSSSSNGIKVRAPKERKQTVKKNHILRFLRDKQEKNMSELIKNRNMSVITAAPIDDFKSDFDSALEHLSSLTDQQKQKKNSTLKKYPVENTNSLIMHPSIHLDDPLNVTNNIFPSSNSMHINPPTLRYPVPKYGCLKGGTLPTYRMYQNVTQKRTPDISIGNSNSIGNANSISDEPNNLGAVQTEGEGSSSSEVSLKREEMKKMYSKMSQEKKARKMKFPKQKRTVRRTFKIGKSKTLPKISVLISNKTIRNQISTKAQELKQTPIQEVRRFLTKKGFIRVGSDAPNDVLRKMYESAVLICGEVQNHNPDNLLYNFLNDI